MNLYEHTIIARQDTSPSEIKLLTDKITKTNYFKQVQGQSPRGI